ncbi:MAG: hypothetical protein ACI854_002568 [Arenicella sp.]|jgi:hypothetical protein
MNTDYIELEDARFSKDFIAKFTSFMDSENTTGFFDKDFSSKEHSLKTKRLLTDYKINLYEFESSTLSLELINAKIGGANDSDLSGRSDFRILRDHIQNADTPGLIMIYRCSRLESDSVQFLSQLNAFLSRSSSRWKIAYLGEIETVPTLLLTLLSPEYVYTSPRLTEQPLSSTGNRKSVLTFGVIAVLCLLAAIYYWSDNRRSPELVIADSTIIEGSTTKQKLLDYGRQGEVPYSIEEDIDAWDSRVADFDQAMSGFINPAATSGPQADSNNIDQTQVELLASSPSEAINEALSFAVKNGDIASIETEIASGGSINMATSSNESLLILASLHGQSNVVIWLLDNGANVASVDRDNGSALYYAAVNGHFEIAKILIKNNASTTQVSKLNKTPLMAAVQNDYLQLSELLITANSDVNQQDHSGWSALYYAIWNDNFEITSLLLENGASASFVDKDGYRPVDLARARKNSKILSLF